MSTTTNRSLNHPQTCCMRNRGAVLSHKQASVPPVDRSLETHLLYVAVQQQHTGQHKLSAEITRRIWGSRSLTSHDIIRYCPGRRLSLKQRRTLSRLVVTPLRNYSQPSPSQHMVLAVAVRLDVVILWYTHRTCDHYPRSDGVGVFNTIGRFVFH